MTEEELQHLLAAHKGAAGALMALCAEMFVRARRSGNESPVPLHAILESTARAIERCPPPLLAQAPEHLHPHMHQAFHAPAVFCKMLAASHPQSGAQDLLEEFQAFQVQHDAGLK